jgi:hypothetical protein
MDDETAEAVGHDDEMHVEMQSMSQEIQTVSTMTQATDFARLSREGCRQVDEWERRGDRSEVGNTTSRSAIVRRTMSNEDNGKSEK